MGHEMERKASADSDSVSVVFMGSPEFVIVVAQTLYEDPQFDLVAVVTAPPSYSRRHKKPLFTPVAEWVRQLPPSHSHDPYAAVQLLEPVDVNVPEVIQSLSEYSPQLVITAAYGQILSDRFLAIADYGVLNIHPSRLPAYRGASPIQSALLHGETTTAVSFVKTVQKLDAGDIVYQHEVDIADHETAVELLERVFVLASQWIKPACLRLMSPGYCGVAQDEKKVSFCAKVDRSSGHMDFKKSAVRLVNQYRALQPWPGCYTFYNRKRVKISGLSLAPTHRYAPFEFGYEKSSQRLMIGTSDGDLMAQTLTLESKKPLKARDFWNMIRSQSSESGYHFSFSRLS